MDGNGRWASRRGLPRLAGHGEGVRAVRRVVEAAPALGIGTLTLYAFSADNWKRPEEEVRGLFSLLARYLAEETARAAREGIRINVVGRRDRLSWPLREAISAAERATAGGSRLHLRLAVDYSARAGLERAARMAARLRRPVDFGLLVSRAIHSDPPAPEVDLVVRTSGEQRLSDFLLWEAAYAELVFTERCWPEFDGRALAEAVELFARRDRRFGGLVAVAGGGR
jgi:undecaprenyl diphosphate synthase